MCSMWNHFTSTHFCLLVNDQDGTGEAEGLGEERGMNERRTEGRIKTRRKQKLGKAQYSTKQCAVQTASWRFNCNIQMNGKCY